MTIRCVAGLLITAALSIAQHLEQPNLMPWPAKVEMGQGSLAIGPTIRIAITGYSEPRLEAAVRRLGEIVPAGSPATLVVQCEHASEAVEQLGEDESYRLEATPLQARLSAPNPLGVLHGLETFRQLIGSWCERPRSAGSQYPRPAAVSVARLASGRVTTLDADRSGQA